MIWGSKKPVVSAHSQDLATVVCRVTHCSQLERYSRTAGECTLQELTLPITCPTGRAVSGMRSHVARAHIDPSSLSTTLFEADNIQSVELQTLISIAEALSLGLNTYQ